MIRRRTGFTLIELLVVIAIIALLVSILMPSLTEAKNLAKETACRMNMKHIGHGFIMYMEENGLLHPPGGQPHSWDWNTNIGYDQVLLPYGNPELWYCPRDPAKQDRGPTWWTRSYGYNNSFMYYMVDDQTRPLDEDGKWYRNAVPAAKVVRPAATILIGDRNLACLVGIWQGGDLEARAGETPEEAARIESQTQTAMRHKGRSSYLFDDAHVESIRPELTVFIPGRSWGYWRLDK